MQTISDLKKTATAIAITTILLLAGGIEAQAQPNSNYGRELSSTTQFAPLLMLIMSIFVVVRAISTKLLLSSIAVMV